MADARPTFSITQRYTQARTDAVQPPDDRTYSAEVTSFDEQSPASSQCAFLFSGKIRKIPLHALEHHTTSISICQELFVRNHDFLSFFSLISAMPFLRQNVAADIIRHIQRQNVAADIIRRYNDS